MVGAIFGVPIYSHWTSYAPVVNESSVAGDTSSSRSMDLWGRDIWPQFLLWKYLLRADSLIMTTASPSCKFGRYEPRLGKSKLFSHRRRWKKWLRFYLPWRVCVRPQEKDASLLRTWLTSLETFQKEDLLLFFFSHGGGLLTFSLFFFSE